MIRLPGKNIIIMATKNNSGCCPGKAKAATYIVKLLEATIGGVCWYLFWNFGGKDGGEE